MADRSQRSRRGKNPVNYSGQDADHGDESGDDFQDQVDEEHGSGDEDAELELDDEEEAEVELGPSKKAKTTNKGAKTASKEAGTDDSDGSEETHPATIDVEQILQDLGLDQEVRSRLLEVPDARDREAWTEFAQGWVDQAANYEANRLPPIMSFIYTPWSAPKYGEAEGKEDKKKKSKYSKPNWTRRDIPWLPHSIPFNTEAWRWVLYYILGATAEQLVLRIPENDPSWDKESKEPNNTQKAARAEKDKAADKKAAETPETLSQKELETKAERKRRAIKKQIDDWLKDNNQLGPLSGSRTKQNDGPTKKTKSTLGIDAKGRPTLSELQLLLNCAWNIDTKSGTMRQPEPKKGSKKGTKKGSKDPEDTHPLYRPPQWPNKFSKHLVAAFGRAELAKMYSNLYSKSSESDDGEQSGSNDQQGKKRKRNPKDDDEAKCNNKCPLHCHPNRKARLPLPPDMPQRRVPAQPLLNPLGDATDDIFWENQFTDDDHIRWFSLDKGDVAPDRWPLAPANFAGPTAWRLPRFHSARGSEGATDGGTAPPKAGDQRVSGTEGQEEDNGGQDLPQVDVPRGEEEGEGAPEAEQQPPQHKAGEIPDDLIDPSLFH